MTSVPALNGVLVMPAVQSCAAHPSALVLFHTTCRQLQAASSEAEMCHKPDQNEAQHVQCCICGATNW